MNSLIFEIAMYLDMVLIQASHEIERAFKSNENYENCALVMKINRPFCKSCRFLRCTFAIFFCHKSFPDLA